MGFRIKCDDNGYPKQSDDETVSGRDHSRAKQKVPRHDYRGQTFSEMSATLNGWLEDMPHVSTKSCDSWNVTDLHQLQALLLLSREDSLDAIYQKAGDNRRLIRPDLDEVELSWEGLKRAVASAGDPQQAHQVLRDGHCHEAVMWYTHHLTESVKKALADSHGADAAAAVTEEARLQRTCLRQGACI